MGYTEIFGYISRRQCSRNATPSGDFCWSFACRCHVWGCGGELPVVGWAKNNAPEGEKDSERPNKYSYEYFTEKEDMFDTTVDESQKFRKTPRANSSGGGSATGRMTRRKTQTSAFPSGLTPRSGRSGFCHTGKGSNFPYTKCPVFFRERNVLRIPKYSSVSLQFRCCCGIVSCRLCCPEATQG